MARFILYFSNNKYSPNDYYSLLKYTRVLYSNKNAIIRDIRISNTFLEIDVTINQLDLSNMITKLKPIGIHTCTKSAISNKTTKINAIKNGILYFNDQHFWECHEILEDIWKNCNGIEKNILQGIILVAAAFVHYQKNENTTCISILNRALNKLIGLNNYYGININLLKKNIIKITLSKQIALFRI